MMALLLGLVFCIVSPPIAVIAAAYFLVNSIIARYQVCYVYSPRFETGGQVGAAACFQVLLVQFSRGVIATELVCTR